MKSFYLSKSTVIIICAVYYALVLNYPVLVHFYSLAEASGRVFALSGAFVLMFTFILMFTLISLPYIFKAFMIFLTLTSSFSLYGAYYYHAIYDYDMIVNIFETNSSEASSYLSFSLIVFIFLTGILPSLFLFFVKIKPSTSLFKALLSRMILIIVALLLLAGIYLVYYKSYASVGRNNSYLNKMINPAHFYYTVKYLNKKYFRKKLKYLEIGKDAKMIASSNKKPTLMILVLGETARAQNSSYNGYARDTNPYTRDLGIIAIQDVASCATATAISLPCMFSNMTRESYKYERANTQDNVLDIMSHAGVEVLWKDHNGGDKAVAKNVQLINIPMHDNPQSCKDNSCYDEVLLEGLAKSIEANSKDKLIVLHIAGSHGPTYWLRYPKEMTHFKPSCQRSDIDKCTDEELVNVYDNTLVYTDYFLSKSIALLKEYSDQYNVGLMYLSDHGESLGKNGFYLHGSPYFIAPIEQKRVPWYLWMPKEYAEAKSIDRTCLEAKVKHGKYSHDNFFHTLLGYYGVKTKIKEGGLDIIEGCRR
ncbi:Sulfatase [hydrothermal vent metagenome]|uniref:Sulfatase n=1 Tax=hydrothermal vent metagenome TaxID=652676 RepID=A0A1W1C7Q8_9ZZZZ